MPLPQPVPGLKAASPQEVAHGHPLPAFHLDLPQEDDAVSRRDRQTLRRRRARRARGPIGRRFPARGREYSQGFALQEGVGAGRRRQPPDAPDDLRGTPAPVDQAVLLFSLGAKVAAAWS